MYYVKKEPKKDCPFYYDCLEQPKYKPLLCKLWPFHYSKTGLLILYHDIFNCPNYNKGTISIFENCKADLIDIFGKEWYDEKEKLIRL
jgi:hypothetical protein